MKVLLVCSVYTNGVTNISSQFVHHQALALKKKGVDVCVLSLDTRSFRRKRKHGIHAYTIDDIPVYVASFPCGPLGPILKLVRSTLAKRAFYRIQSEWGMPNIIHGHFYYNANVIIDIVKKYHIPLVTTEHASSILSQNNTEQIRNNARYVYENSTKVLCVSNHLRRSIQEFYTGDVHIISNIVSGNFYYEETGKNKEFTFVSTGNLIQLKRHDLTLQAFAKFHKNVPNSRLIIIGSGDLKTKLEQLTKSLKLEDNVEFKGRIDNKNLLSIYRQCHCFILPSEYETFGVAFIEAIAAGLPVIGPPCVAENGIITKENGLVFEKYTKDDLCNAMLYMHSHHQKYGKAEMSKNIISRYSEERIAGEIIAVYTLILKRGMLNEP